MNQYLMPVLYHLTCKPPFDGQCGLDTINCHSKLNINTLHHVHNVWKITSKKKGEHEDNKYEQNLHLIAWGKVLGYHMKVWNMIKTSLHENLSKF